MIPNWEEKIRGEGEESESKCSLKYRSILIYVLSVRKTPRQKEELALFLKSPACDQSPPAFYSHPKDSTTKQPLSQLKGSGHVILTLGRRVIYGWKQTWFLLRESWENPEIKRKLGFHDGRKWPAQEGLWKPETINCIY